MNSILPQKHAPALGLLTLFALALWSRVLFTGQVLLPGAMLSGFAPFGGAPTGGNPASGNPQAPWTILYFDAIGQYFPWRHFAGEELRAGHIPLWNPFEFCGTPFLANAQSAVFYPLNLPFWLMDTAYAFGVAALLHSLLAMFATYFLCQRWQLSRAASVVAAVAFAGCGYLAAWALLPTLFSTASWLPLCLLLFEKASDDGARSRGAAWLLVGALACALLAGHAQIFFYIVLALALRQMFLARRGRGFVVLIGALLGAAMLSMLQILPTLELARYGHRAQAGGATAGAWQFVRERALQVAELPSLVVPAWPMQTGSLNENFGYIGIGVALLMLAGLGWRAREGQRQAQAQNARGQWFALALAVFGLLYGLATPIAQLFFGLPGVAQMGGTGRALVLWSLGAALLAGFGVDFLRAKLKSSLVPAVALLVIAAELGFNAFTVQPTAPRAQIYPRTALTDWLQKRVDRDNRVLFYTPQEQWAPTEALLATNPPQTHPVGALPPNGALVYRLHEVNGYDSLSPAKYRDWIDGQSPQFNGNMVLINDLNALALDALALRYIVVPQSVNLGARAPRDGKIVFQADGCDVYQVPTRGQLRLSGAAFYPGWKAGGYNPETFRMGAFVSLCALGFTAAGLMAKRKT